MRCGFLGCNHKEHSTLRLDASCTTASSHETSSDCGSSMTRFRGGAASGGQARTDVTAGQASCVLWPVMGGARASLALLLLFITSQVRSAALDRRPSSTRRLYTARRALAGQRQLIEVSSAPVSGPSVLPPHAGGLYKEGDVPKTDQHLRVEDTTAFPFSAFGFVEFESYSYPTHCSGALIAPSVVLTVCAALSYTCAETG